MGKKSVCYFCEGTQFSKVYSINGYEIVRCNNCGLVFTLINDCSVQANNEEFYRLENWGQIYFALQEHLKSRYQSLLEQIKKYKNSGKILDVGCSLGLFLDVARKHGFKTYGIEPVSSAAIFARTKLNLNVAIGTLDQIRFSDKFFDVVCLFDVLEHIPEPLNVLKEIKRILKDDGLLVIQCPNINSNMARLCGQHWRWLLVPQHLFHFSKSTLAKLLNKAGFKILHCSTFDEIDEFVDNILDVVSMSIPIVFIRKIFLRFKFLLKPALNFTFKVFYLNRQYTEGALILVFSAKEDRSEN